MYNNQATKTPMGEAAPDVRNKNYKEVALGYTAEEAVNEANRCLNCKHKPCVAGCPVNVDIPRFIEGVKAGNFLAAYDVIRETNSLPAVCGRVCPQETQCEELCVRKIKGESVAIGRLERFCADEALRNAEAREEAPLPEKNGKKVAIVGSGPAGLSCAGDLAKLGFDVDVFEAFHETGGVLVYGIPEFRLPKAIIKKEVQALEALGVKFHKNMFIGKIMSVDDLFADGYSAVFIGSGAGSPNFLGIPGESLNRVFSANEYLTRVNLMRAYDASYDTPVVKSRNVAVIGGGNVAMDAARCALRLGAEHVYIVYRRGEAELPARLEEIHHAKEEGIIFKLLTNPKRINADENGNVVSMTCDEMELGEPDESGRRRPKVKPDSEFDIEVDTVIVSIGTSPNPVLQRATPGLEVNKWGCIVTSDGVTTTKPRVYAGGDAVTGAATVILAMGAGKQAAAKIAALCAEE